MVHHFFNDHVEKLVNEMNQNAPAAVGPGVQNAGSQWLLMQQKRSLIEGLWEGLAMTFPLCFLVLLLSTGNWIIALPAVLTIFFVVSSVIGVANCMFQWELGTRTWIDHVKHKSAKNLSGRKVGR